MENKHSNVKEQSSNVCADKLQLASHSSSKVKRKKMQMEGKKKQAPKRAKNLKSKQVKSDDPKKQESIKRKRTTVSDIYDDVEARFNVLERAERVLSSLSDEFPGFVKCMLPSNVSHGFWMHLPKAFCDKHLPSHDTNVTLVDEWGNEYKTSYLLGRHGLSAGWRAFAISHRLLKGDILIFRLIKPCRLKIDIVRVNGHEAVDAAICLMNLDACDKITYPDGKDNRRRRSSMKFIEPYIHDVCKPEACVQDEGKNASCSRSSPIVDRARRNGKDPVSEVFEGSDIVNHPQSKNLRCTKASFLHDRMHDGVACI